MKNLKPRLGVNIDHVATLRRLRDTPYPDLLMAAQLCIKGGADQITVHLREDRRHIVDKDVIELKKSITVDLNLEMAATQEMLDFALSINPHSICVVPEKREERTTEGGLDLRNEERNIFLEKICKEARKKGILVSFFIEPDLEDIRISKELGAQCIELHTGTLCIAHQANNRKKFESEWAKYIEGIALGNSLGLMVHAGHGIDYNIAPIMAKHGGVLEYNIGHSMICESVFIGIEEATRRMKNLLSVS